VGIAPPPVQKARIDGNDSGGDRIRRFGFRAHRFRFPSMKGIGVTRNALPFMPLKPASDFRRSEAARMRPSSRHPSSFV